PKITRPPDRPVKPPLLLRRIAVTRPDAAPYDHHLLHTNRRRVMREGDHFNYRRVRWLGSTARLLLLGGIVTLVVAGAAFAATRGGTTARAGVDTLVIANAVKVDSIDPAVNSANESIWLDQNIYNRLVQS